MFILLSTFSSATKSRKWKHSKLFPYQIIEMSNKEPVYERERVGTANVVMFACRKIWYTKT